MNPEYWYAGLISSQVLDKVSTWVGLRMGATELNPVITYMIEKIGVHLGVAVALSLSLITCAWLIDRKQLLIIKSLTIITSFIVVVNVLGIVAVFFNG